MARLRLTSSCTDHGGFWRDGVGDQHLHLLQHESDHDHPAPNRPGTNTLPVPRALLADITLPVGCESAQTAHNPREADSSNAFDSDLGSSGYNNKEHDVLLVIKYCIIRDAVTSISCRAARELPFPKELDTRRRARDAIFLTGGEPSSVNA